MNTPSQISRPKRRLWPWILLGVVCLPFVVVGAVAVSVLSLDSDAAVLRRQVVKATQADWDTKVQVSTGRVTLGMIRAGLSFVQNNDIEEAKLALATVRGASVGVYQLQGEARDWDCSALMNRTDESMRRRGWVRAVGVNDGPETVMVYFRDGAEEPEEVCVAVLGRRELVVVSARIDPEAMVEFVERQTDGKLGVGRAMRLARN